MKVYCWLSLVTSLPVRTHYFDIILQLEAAQQRSQKMQEEVIKT